MVRGRDQLKSTYFTVAFSKVAALRFIFADLWFPCRIILYRSEFLVAPYIGESWYWDPILIMSIFALSSWLWNRLAILVGSRNYEP